jgi:mannose-6-phosphate isomerase-like protein (cupin superfamily)
MRAVHRGVRDDAVESDRDPNGDALVTAQAGWFDVRFVQKPWGHETIWAHTEHYVGKMLHVKAGHALSLQYHNVKDETLHLLRGEMIYRVKQGDRLVELPFKAGQSYRNTPGTIHQMEAVTDCDILESSTPHLDDVVRLTDRYGREGTSAP